MKIKKRSISSNQRALIERIVAGAFLVIFTLFQVALSLHLDEDSHEHLEEQCSEADEENPCHITLVHKGQLKGCEHPQHLTETENECELCTLLAHRSVVALESKKFTDFLIKDYQFHHTPYFHYIHLSLIHI